MNSLNESKRFVADDEATISRLTEQPVRFDERIRDSEAIIEGDSGFEEGFVTWPRSLNDLHKTSLV